MASFEKTAKTPRAGRFPPPRRGPGCRSRLGLLTALDVARRPSPPHPQQGPRPELRSRLPFTAVHRTVHRPQHLHGSSPSTLDARVPAIQRPSARSHHTVDNSLITGRIEYSTFINLPLDECIVNTPPENREVIKREARKRKTQASDKKLRKVRTVTHSNTDRFPKTRATARRSHARSREKTRKPGAKTKAETPQAKFFPLTSATLPK